MPEDIEEPREIPMLGDLIVGLNPQETFQRRVAAHLAEASVIGGVAQQGGEQCDAPEQCDRKVVAAAAPRSSEPLQERGVGDGLNASAHDAQSGRVFECRPGKQRLSDVDPHRSESPLLRALIIHRDKSPTQGGRGVKFVVPRALPYKVAEKPGLKSRFWGKRLFGLSGGLVPQHGNGVSRSREFAYTSQALDCEAKEVTNARDGGKGQSEREAVGGFGGTQSVGTAAKGIVQRALILVLGFRGLLNEQIAEEVGLNRQQVGVWRKRWRDAWESLCVWECTEPHRLREAILEVLSDAPCPGCPGKITAEQVAQILAVACESPKLSGCPITRWTHRELRDEVVKRGIVESISVVQVGRYLKQSALQPHRSKMWLNTTEKNPDTFEREAAAVCQTYLDAPRKAALDGTHTVSVDEATSLQAIERNAPDKPVQPGSVTKQEFEYTRHGTTTLTAGLNVVTGQIVSPTLEATRTEPEFVDHMREP